MPTCSRFVLAALIAGLVGPVAAIAQQPTPAQDAQKNEAELRLLEELLRRELADRRDREAKKPVAPEPKAKPVAPKEPPATGSGWLLVVPADPKKPNEPKADAALAQLRELTKSPDPKVVALATELLKQLDKSAKPATPKAGHGIEIELTFDGNGKGFPLELLLGAAGKGKGSGKPLQIVLEPGSIPGLPFDFKSGQIVIVADEPTKKTEPAKGASTLKMSADGRSAAVVSADGTVVVYDVASGKELMRFPAHK